VQQLNIEDDRRGADDVKGAVRAINLWRTMGNPTNHEKQSKR